MDWLLQQTFPVRSYQLIIAPRVKSINSKIAEKITFPAFTPKEYNSVQYVTPKSKKEESKTIRSVKTPKSVKSSKSKKNEYQNASSDSDISFEYKKRKAEKTRIYKNDIAIAQPDINGEAEIDNTPEPDPKPTASPQKCSPQHTKNLQKRVEVNKDLEMVHQPVQDCVLEIDNWVDQDTSMLLIYFLPLLSPCSLFDS